MKLVDRYVAEVGRSLPQKNRADLEREIRSLIEDAIEDAAAAQGRQPDDALVLDVLKQFGPPEKVAAGYGKPQYLIGPRLFPIFRTVLSIVLAVILVVASIGIGVELGSSPQNGQTLGGLIGDVIGGILGSLVAAFGNVVLVFAILERLLPEDTWKEKDWDPRSLEAAPDPEEVSWAEPVFGAIFLLIGLLVLNIYPQWIGFATFADGQWQFAPVLTETFFSYLPVINVLMGLEIVRNALLLQNGRWTAPLRWFEIGLKVASAALLVVMLTGPAIIAFNPADLNSIGARPEIIDGLGRALPSLQTLALALALAATLWDLGKQLYRLYQRGSLRPMVIR